eukprot:11509383-Karenia_brevis.AAC.1
MLRTIWVPRVTLHYAPRQRKTPPLILLDRLRLSGCRMQSRIAQHQVVEQRICGVEQQSCGLVAKVSELDARNMTLEKRLLSLESSHRHPTLSQSKQQEATEAMRTQLTKLQNS